MDLFEVEAFDYQTNLTKTVLTELFFDRYVDEKVIKRQHNFNDEFIFKLDGKTVKTTLGRYIFNRFVLPTQLFDSEYFLNSPVNGKSYGKLFDSVTNALVINLIDKEEFANFTDRITWLGNILVDGIGDSFDSESFYLKPEVEEEIKQLVDSIDPDDIISVEENESKIINILKRELGDKPVGRIMLSGSKGSFENNMKSMVAMRSFNNGIYVKDNLFDGNSIDTYGKVNSLVSTAGRSINTAKGGYASNLIRDGYNHTYLSKKEDCKTDGYLIETITNGNFQEFRYRSVKPLKDANDRFVKWDTLDTDNLKKYSGKTTAVRSPMFCRNKDGYCRTCYGSSYTKNGIEQNLGSLVQLISAHIMNVSMKAFHNLNIDRQEVDFTKITIK